MKRVRWTVAVILILTMMILGGCSGQGTVEDSVIDDGTHDENGGILNDIADGVEDGLDTIEDDTRTDLGNGGAGGNNGSGSAGSGSTGGSGSQMNN